MQYAHDDHFTEGFGELHLRQALVETAYLTLLWIVQVRKKCANKLRPFEVALPIEPIKSPNFSQLSYFLNRVRFFRWVRIASNSDFRG